MSTNQFTAAVAPTRAATHRANRWLALPVVLAGTFMVVLDFFIVNVALPSMQSDLHASDSAVEWVVAGYALTSVVFVITGGDPFLLSPRRIRAITRALAAIPHLSVIRFHTRVPIVAPGRVTPQLVAALEADKAVYVAIHANHPRELTPAVRTACRRLAAAGIPLLGQSVLLRGVNDDVATLIALFRGLVAMRVKPYYLHHPDPAPGTASFRLSLAEGQALMRQLRGRLSGICQPTYVLDLPGGHGKVPVGPAYARTDEAGEAWVIADINGREHCYPSRSPDVDG